MNKSQDFDMMVVLAQAKIEEEFEQMEQAWFGEKPEVMEEDTDGTASNSEAR